MTQQEIQENTNYLKDFVPYEQALELKELGFNEPCMAIYYSKDKSFSWHHHVDHTNDEPILDSGEFNISAPLYQQAFRWFREKHKMAITINQDKNGYYTNDGMRIDTYEEVELHCLKTLIEIVENK